MIVRRISFILSLAVFAAYIFLLPTIAFAEEASELRPRLQVQIGDQSLDFEAVNCPPGTADCSIGWIGEYISAVYSYGVGIAGVLAAVVITAAGLVWLTAAGSPERVSRAKDMIVAALSGLALALFSYIILYAVNPKLTVFDAVKIDVPVINPDIIDESNNYSQIESGQGGGSASVTDLNAETQTALQPYLARGAQVNSTVREGGGRHASGSVVDIHYNSGDQLTQHIESTGQVISLDHGWSNELIGGGAVQAYQMPDNSVWVREPHRTESGGVAYHWHTEFPTNGWEWIPYR